MTGRFRFTPEAEAQLAEIIDFIAADGEDAARRVLNSIHEGVYSYLIVYDPASSPLSVIAILRGARDVEQILKNR